MLQEKRLTALFHNNPGERVAPEEFSWGGHSKLAVVWENFTAFVHKKYTCRRDQAEYPKCGNLLRWHFPWHHASLPPQRHLDRFVHFCRAHSVPNTQRHTFTQTTPRTQDIRSLPVGRIYAMHAMRPNNDNQNSIENNKLL